MLGGCVRRGGASIALLGGTALFAQPAPRSAGEQLSGDSSLVGLRSSPLAVREDAGTPRVTGQLQTRYIVNRREVSGGDDIASGFVLRRARLGVRGENAATGIEYVVVGSFDREGGTFELLNGYLDKSFDTGEGSLLTVRLGRFRPPSLLELTVPSRRRQAMERTLVAEALKPDRAPGVGAYQEFERLRVSGSVTDGGELGGDDFWQYSGRVDGVLEGEWSRFGQFSTFGERDSGFDWLLGAGVLYVERDEAASNANDSETLTWTVDTLMKHGRYAMYAAVFGSRVEPATGDAVDRIGVVAQGSARFGERYDAFVRYEWADSGDVTAAGSADELSLLTVGGNYYAVGHALKLTGDVGYGFNGVSEFWAAEASGYLPDGAGERGQVVLRLQVQVVF